METRTGILIIFAATYAGIAMGRIPGLRINRPGIALLGAISLMILGGVRTSDVVSFVNWPTIFLLFGFFVISAQLRLSGLYDKVGLAIAKRLHRPAWFLCILMVVSGGLSAFLNHDIVCFVFAPILIASFQRQHLNAVPFLIALAISSNIGAAATLLGNPQNMMISQVAHLDFGRYMLWSAVPVLFAMTTAYVIIWLIARNDLRVLGKPQHQPRYEPHPFNRIHTIKGIVILIIAIGLFFTHAPMEVIALAAAGIHLASPKFRTNELLGLVDWPILILFMGLFVVTGAFESTGCGTDAVRWLAQTGFNLNSPTNLAIATTGLANVIGNSATVMLLMKIVNLSQPITAYVLALANSFGGSLLVIGSVSNIIVVQQAREMGIEISFWDYAKYGIPVTLAALGGLIGWVFLVG